ncbi:2-oxoglutarate oxidoreductase [Siculibacillus lacustris]|uniref:2-oxoglutarate oxidoreductase n=1 Tax=Siculibacillus lacustris TaxID=1549641 RepID=A0A4Q9VSM1_9HYPH|nr:thiamine pyrophosphate-dependent enzyme [Siculibacillus lacustris]TBW38992.1 2-oxoglutarate oxidoreductase [Siculibacillus lacustris]
MNMIYHKPEALEGHISSYCPGCLHGVAHRLVAEVIDELGIRERTLAVLPIGCATLGTNYFNVDLVVSNHGRAPAVATGYKRSRPENIVFTYQGDGDLASIGLGEILHAANRGENFTTIFINNGIYGMTGGQLAPTSLVGQKATTAPDGRDPKTMGYPLHMAELIAQLEAPVFVARFSLHRAAYILKAKAGIRKAFENQIAGRGFSFVELLSNCPTNWGLSPAESLDHIREKMIPVFPLKTFKTI